MKYIIDVTQLVHWPGRLTGIPRVVEELARRFPSTGKETMYVSWVKELGAFCEIDFNATLAIRGNGIEYRLRTQGIDMSERSPTVAVETPVEASRLSKVQTTKILAKKIVRRLKLEKIPIVERLRRGRYLKMMQNYRQVSIQKDDIVFIGAGEWWDKAFITYLEDAHSAGAKIVQVSHDLLPITAPQFSGHATESLSNYNRHIFSIASLVLSVSYATKQDIITWLTREGLSIPPIEVFRLGEDFTKEAPVKPRSEDFVNTGLKGNDFILTVGTIEARKNHALLYYTYKLAKARGIKLPKLLIVGRRGWKTDDVYGYMTQDPDTKDLLIPLHDIADAELSWLYDNCLFTVFPSQCEGWGMPIAESITRGVPVIAGNVSSMAEVAPDFTVSFSPNSTDELLNAIISLLDPEVLAAQKKHIRDYRPTTWDDSFEQVAKFLETLQ